MSAEDNLKEASALVEQRILEGTVSAKEVTAFLKLGDL